MDWIYLCSILGFLSGDYEEYYLLGSGSLRHGTASVRSQGVMFHRTVFVMDSSSSGQGVQVSSFVHSRNFTFRKRHDNP
jgi:hypothetical protein